MTPTFLQWMTAQFGITSDEIEALKLNHAFEILVCRCVAARRLGASNPLITVSPKRAGGNSRQVTRRMLAQLDYSPTQLRVIHRLLGGSTGGWPGLLALYVKQEPATHEQRVYVRKQLRLCGASTATSTQSTVDQPAGTRSGAKPG